jgi:hypothetical protein
MDLKNYQTDSYLKKDIRGKEQRFLLYWCNPFNHSTSNCIKLSSDLTISQMGATRLLFHLFLHSRKEMLATMMTVFERFFTRVFFPCDIPATS